MRDTMSTLRNVLQDAEKKQVNNSAVKEWLQRLKVVVRDADDLLDEFATEGFAKTNGNSRDYDQGGTLFLYTV